MIERIVENWLINANERMFQVPFCQILLNQGHTILHLSRHCAMEQGKDIISIDSKGNTCVFQLKGIDAQRMTISKWQSLNTQLGSLIHSAPFHPSIKSTKHHKSFLVINADIDEEAQSEIQNFNISLKARKFPKLEIISKGKFLRGLLDIKENFWPVNPVDIKNFLELYLQDGSGYPNKSRLSELLYSNLNQIDPQQRINRDLIIRKLLSNSILVSLISSNFAKVGNYVSELENYIVLMAHQFSIIEENNLENDNEIVNIIEMQLEHIYNLLILILEDIQSHEHLHSENMIEAECITYKPRITYLISLMSALFLWTKLNKRENMDDILSKITDFITGNDKSLVLWGEYAAPQFLTYYFYKRFTQGNVDQDFILLSLIKGYISNYQHMDMFPDPYTSLDDYIESAYKFRSDSTKRAGFYGLESFMDLFVTKNIKGPVKELWPDYSKIIHNKYIPENREFYFWHSSHGNFYNQILPLRQSWHEWRERLKLDDGNEIPNLMKQYPFFYMLFLIVYPHRLNSSGARWLLNKLYELRKEKAS